MPYKFSPFLGNLDYYENVAPGSGNVIGPMVSTDKAIARYSGTTGELIQDSPGTLVQDSGAIQAQAYIFNRQIIADVTVPDKSVLIQRNIELLTGDVLLLGDSELLLL